MSAALKRLQATGDPTEMMAVDAWAWAYYSKLKLNGGVYDVKGHEYQIAPLQCDARVQVAKKATQTGWTEILVIRALHAMKYGRYPQGALYLFPTADEVVDFSAARFKPFLTDNLEAIGQYVKETDRANLRQIGEGFLYFRGARLSQKIEGHKKTSSKLKSLPADAVYYDEYDEMDQAAIPLAQGRLEHSTVKEEFYLANPTIPDFGIDKLYQASDQRVWMIQCMACGKETCMELEFPDCLQRQSDGSVIRVCKHCKREIFPRNGSWVAQYPNRDVVGWWMSHLISRYKDPKDMLDKFEDTDTDLQEFHNLNLGMAYIAAENRLTRNDVYLRCGTEPMLVAHKGPCAAGVDVGKLLHVTIGYKVGEKAAKIVKTARVTSFNDVHDLFRKFGVRVAVFDLYPETRKVREFADACDFPVYGCDYQENQRGVAAYDEKSKVVIVNRTEICDASHNLVTTLGRLELPRRNDEIEEYALEMCNVAKVLEEDKETGSKVYRYRKLGADHYRHATNYLLLALAKVPAVRGGVNTATVKSNYYYG